MSEFPKRVYVKEYVADLWGWKTLCVVYDNEAFGFLKNLLSGFEYKTESVNVVEVGPAIVRPVFPVMDE